MLHTNAGAHSMPSVIGNAIGGLLTDFIIKRYVLFESTLSRRIRQCIAISAVFVALTAGIEHCEMAIGSSWLYLSSNVGMVAGISIASALLQSTLSKQLRIFLEGVDGMQDVRVLPTSADNTSLINELKSSLERCLVLNTSDPCMAVSRSLSRRHISGAWGILMICINLHWSHRGCSRPIPT
jgi:hypothetical protein